MTSEPTSEPTRTPEGATSDAAGDPSRAVDLGAPLLAQVGALGDRYDAWVHAPVAPHAAEKALSGGDVQPARWSGSLRIFRTGWLERLSHIAWWHVLVVWVPIVVACFWIGAAVHGADAGRLALMGVFGVLLWTVVEYTLHRFVFHYKPRSALGRKAHFLAHGIHHLDPWDATRLVFPPLAGLAIAAGILGLLRLALPWADAWPTLGGLLAGYIAYDMTHYYTHHAKPRSRWGRFLKRYHLEHHHRHWERMFGVSQPLWDIVLRTGRPKERRP